MLEYLNKTSQPFPHVLCLGDDTKTSQAFTIISGNALESEILLGAVDICFKAFYVLDLNYTKHCKQTWEFIQHAVYGIEGHESPSVKFLRTAISARTWWLCLVDDKPSLNKMMLDMLERRCQEDQAKYGCVALMLDAMAIRKQYNPLTQSVSGFVDMGDGNSEPDVAMVLLI
ncbi:hypothetical protein ABVT39_023519 [Epinephelus coioides]